MTTATRFNDQGYLNWLRGTLAVLYLKQGLEEFVENEAETFHLRLSDSVRHSTGTSGQNLPRCYNCTTGSIIRDFRTKTWKIRDQCKTCGPWLQAIVDHHMAEITKLNTDPQKWPSSKWEVVKMFMPVGCRGLHSAQQADAQAVLTFLKNCRHFYTSSRIREMDLIDKLIEIRNSLLHSGDLKVNDDALKDYFVKILTFLRGMKSLSPSESSAVTDAVNNITEIQANKLDLSLNKELELRALQAKQVALDTDVKRLEIALGSQTDTVDNVQADLQIQRQQVAANTTEVTRLQTDMNKLKAETRANDTRLDEMEDTVAGSECRLGVVIAKTRGDITGLQQEIKELHKLEDEFYNFLKTNGLRKDIARLEANMDQQYERIKALEGTVQTLLEPFQTTQRQSNSNIFPHTTTQMRVESPDEQEEEYELPNEDVVNETTSSANVDSVKAASVMKPTAAISPVVAKPVAKIMPGSTLDDLPNTHSLQKPIFCDAVNHVHAGVKPIVSVCHAQQHTANVFTAALPQNQRPTTAVKPLPCPAEDQLLTAEVKPRTRPVEDQLPSADAKDTMLLFKDAPSSFVQDSLASIVKKAGKDALEHDVCVSYDCTAWSLVRKETVALPDGTQYSMTTHATPMAGITSSRSQQTNTEVREGRCEDCKQTEKGCGSIFVCK